MRKLTWTAWRAAAALLLAALTGGGAWAGVDLDVAITTNPVYYKAWLGTQANNEMFACAKGDFNGDGVDDLALVEPPAGTEGRTNNGAVYILYGLHNSTGAVYNVGSVYNLRFDGASTNDNLAWCWAWDVNGDGIDDLVIRADGSGQLYVIYGPLPSGTGTFLDLSNPLNYNLKILLPGNFGVPYPYLADLNGDGIDDMIIEAPGGAVSGGNSGSLYVLNGPFPAGTGNVRDLSNPSNFNLRIDGTVLNQSFTGNINSPAPFYVYSGGPSSAVGDLNGDGAPDLAVGSSRDSAWNRANNGVVFVSTGPFPASTGNIWKSTDSMRFMLRYAGDQNSTSLSRPVIADFNGDGHNDLCMAADYDDTLSRSNNGAVYCVYGPLNAQIDTQVDLNTPSNYNLAFHGASNSDFLGYNNIRAADLNADGIQDLVLESEFSNINANNGTGALYIINGGPTNFSPGTGQSRDLGIAANFNVRLTRQTLVGGFPHFGYAPALFKDLNGDGNLDLVVTNQGYINNTTCGANQQGETIVFYGPTPSNAGNIWDTTQLYDYRLHYANCSYDQLPISVVGDFDGDGLQDAVVSYRFYSAGLSNRGAVFVVPLSTAAPRITSPSLFTNSTSPLVTWTPVLNASTYLLQVDVDPRFPSPTSVPSGGTSISVSGLTGGQSYYARVTATSGNFQHYGPVASFTVITAAPTAPTLITPGDATGSNPSIGTQTPFFDWTDASTQ